MCYGWNDLPQLPDDFTVINRTTTQGPGGQILRQHHLASGQLNLTITELLHVYEIKIEGTEIPFRLHSLPDALRPHLSLGA